MNAANEHLTFAGFPNLFVPAEVFFYLLMVDC